jgi:hypothetical protein
MYIAGKRQSRFRKLEEQLPDALDLMSRALKAGHALPSGLQMVGDETQDPIAGEFRIVHDEINYGVAVPTALPESRAARAEHRYALLRDCSANTTRSWQEPNGGSRQYQCAHSRTPQAAGPRTSSIR